jgi:hypothetical protein
MDIKYNTDTKIEDNARLYQLQKANFDQEVNTAVSLSFTKYDKFFMFSIFIIVLLNCYISFF